MARAGISTGSHARTAVVALLALAVSAAVLSIGPVPDAHADGTDVWRRGTGSTVYASERPWPVATRAGAHAIKLVWSKVGGASGYIVYRKAPKQKKFKKVKTVAAGGKRVFKDRKLASNATYAYKVAAVFKENGKKRIGKKSFWVKARAYARGARLVNPGKVTASPAKLDLKLGQLSFDYFEADISVGSKDRKAGGRKCRAFSGGYRWYSTGPQAAIVNGWHVDTNLVGSCKLYAVADNGLRSKAIPVTVTRNERAASVAPPTNILLLDPELLEWLDANLDDLHDVSEMLFTGLAARGGGYTISGKPGAIAAYPSYLGAGVRARLDAIASWEGFGEDLYLQDVVYSPGVMSYHVYSSKLAADPEKKDYYTIYPFKWTFGGTTLDQDMVLY